MTKRKNIWQTEIITEKCLKYATMTGMAYIDWEYDILAWTATCIELIARHG